MKKILISIALVTGIATAFVIGQGLMVSKVSLDGIYEYVYEYNSNDFKENHYMKFTTVDGTLQGIYYGTSDDFDEAREGYLPGFYKESMKNIKLTASTLTFDLYVSNAQMYKKPITPLGEPKDNAVWGVGGQKVLRQYSFTILGDSMTMHTDFGPRIFTKMIQK